MQWLPDTLADTLHAVSSVYFRSTKQIAARHNDGLVSVRNTANRLQRLRALKLVICRKVERVKTWRRA